MAKHNAFVNSFTREHNLTEMRLQYNVLADQFCRLLQGGVMAMKWKICIHLSVAQRCTKSTWFSWELKLHSWQNMCETMQVLPFITFITLPSTLLTSSLFHLVEVSQTAAFIPPRPGRMFHQLWNLDFWGICISFLVVLCYKWVGANFPFHRVRSCWFIAMLH